MSETEEIWRKIKTGEIKEIRTQIDFKPNKYGKYLFVNQFGFMWYGDRDNDQ